METNAAKGSAELRLERLVQAPREKVWEAWTHQEKVAKWWGPKNFSNPMCKVDAKPGGDIRIDMQGPDGTIYPMKGTFRELVRPEWLVFKSTALDENGMPVLESLSSVEFESENGQTRIIIRASASAHNSEGLDALKGMEEGWTQSLNKLELFLRT